MTMLNSSHLYNMMREWQKKQQWGPLHSRDSPLRTMRDSVGMRLAVLGYGSIGRQVARVCKAMGMDVIAFTAHERKTPESKKDRGFIVPGTGDPEGEIPSAWYHGFEKSKLHEFLRQDIDVLVVSVPLTKETHHLLSKEEFDILAQKNAFVSNISRGQIIDQEELIRQLEAFEKDRGNKVMEGRKGIRGAALDVTDPEPLPDGHPLWTAPNCIVTPHISGLGISYTERAFQVLELNLERKEKGEDLVNLVNRNEGY
jgi:phosphoglycerate dehydrogenase-like enzyme